MNKYNHTWSKAELMEMFQLRMEGTRSKRLETNSASRGSVSGRF